MSFTTNKYTRPVLLADLKSINARRYSSFDTFVSAFSPRAGVKSAKIHALASTLGTSVGSLKVYFTGLTSSQAKNNLIKSLKALN